MATRCRPRTLILPTSLQRVQIFSVGLDQLSEQKVFLPLFQAENFQQVVHFFLHVFERSRFLGAECARKRCLRAAKSRSASRNPWTIPAFLAFSRSWVVVSASDWFSSRALRRDWSSSSASANWFSTAIMLEAAFELFGFLTNDV